MINAQLEGYLFDVSYKEVKNGVVQEAAADIRQRIVLKNMASEVMVVTAPLEVHVPGNVLYTSDNAAGSLLSDDVICVREDRRGSDRRWLRNAIEAGLYRRREEL